MHSPAAKMRCRTSLQILFKGARLEACQSFSGQCACACRHKATSSLNPVFETAQHASEAVIQPHTCSRGGSFSCVDPALSTATASQGLPERSAGPTPGWGRLQCTRQHRASQLAPGTSQAAWLGDKGSGCAKLARAVLCTPTSSCLCGAIILRNSPICTIHGKQIALQNTTLNEPVTAHFLQDTNSGCC